MREPRASLGVRIQGRCLAALNRASASVAQRTDTVEKVGLASDQPDFLKDAFFVPQ